MDAYSIAHSLLGDIHLSPSQTAHLRALDHQFQQGLFALSHTRRDATRRDATRHADLAAATQRAHDVRGDDDSDFDMAELEARIAAEVIAMLTPEQRRILQDD